MNNHESKLLMCRTIASARMILDHLPEEDHPEVIPLLDLPDKCIIPAYMLSLNLIRIREERRRQVCAS